MIFIYLIIMCFHLKKNILFKHSLIFFLIIEFRIWAQGSNCPCLYRAEIASLSLPDFHVVAGSSSGPHTPRGSKWCREPPPQLVWALAMHLYSMLMFTVSMLDISNSFVVIMLCVYVLSVLPAVIVKALSWLDI